MSDDYLSKELKKAQTQLASAGREAEEKIQKIQEKSFAGIREALTDFGKSISALSVRIARLREIQSGETAPRGPHSASAQRRMAKVKSADSKPSAGELILRALAENGSMPSAALDAVVMDAGWTKAAAEKSKQILKKHGEVSAQKRVWSITEMGLKNRPSAPE